MNKPFGEIVHWTHLFIFNSGGVIIGIMTLYGTHFIHKNLVFNHSFKMGKLFQIKVIYSQKSFRKVDAKASSKRLGFCRWVALVRITLVQRNFQL